MCLIVLAYKVHPRFPLILAANRDEFLDRPTLAAHFWKDAPHVLAGRDQRAGGTWLGVTRHGRFAALTNYRDLSHPRKHGPSRGQLVRQALDADIDASGTAVYEGFNLLYGPLDGLRYHTNIDGTDKPVGPGVHGLSNHLLDTPWPKVVRAKAGLMECVNARTAPVADDLFKILAFESAAPDADLPATGVPLEWERALSSIFIRMDGYGTRCSTVVMLDTEGNLTFEERTFPGSAVVEHHFSM